MATLLGELKDGDVITYNGVSYTLSGEHASLLNHCQSYLETFGVWPDVSIVLFPDGWNQHLGRPENGYDVEPVEVHISDLAAAVWNVHEDVSSPSSKQWVLVVVAIGLVLLLFI